MATCTAQSVWLRTRCVAAAAAAGRRWNLDSRLGAASSFILTEADVANGGVSKMLLRAVACVLTPLLLLLPPTCRWNLDSRLAAPSSFISTEADLADGGVSRLRSHLQQQLAGGAHIMLVYRQQTDTVSMP
jgi:hypothetical protein